MYGYHVWWMQEAWREMPLGRLAEGGVFFFDLRADTAGVADAHGWPTRWDDLRHAAGAAGTPVYPTVSVQGAERFERVFASGEAARTVRADALAAMRTAEAGGLHLDAEAHGNVSRAARQGFTRFVRRLREDLPAGAHLSLFAPAFDRADALDEAALAEHVDRLVVQGYDLHARGSETAGPVAPLAGWGGRNWQAILARYDRLGVPREKLVFSVPLFGYEWPTRGPEPGARAAEPGRTISYAPGASERVSNLDVSALERVAKHGKRRDDTSRSPYYVFQTEGGQWRQGWFEDTRSLRAKYQFARENGLAGIALFALGYDGGRLWPALFEPEGAAGASR
jgi:chitinase